MERVKEGGHRRTFRYHFIGSITVIVSVLCFVKGMVLLESLPVKYRYG